jgi:hypothetical protein
MTTQVSAAKIEARVEDKSSARRYALAVAAALAALLLRLALSPWYGTGFAFQTAFAAIAFTAWYCGIGPSIVATLISMLGCWYWFLPPVNSFALKDPKTEIPGMIGRFVLAGFIIAVGEANRRSKARLEREVAERIKMTAEAAAATAKFRAPKMFSAKCFGRLDGGKTVRNRKKRFEPRHRRLRKALPIERHFSTPGQTALNILWTSRSIPFATTRGGFFFSTRPESTSPI